MSNALQLGQQNPILYDDLVKELRARNLYQNLPDGVDATYLDCREFINLLDLMNILPGMNDSTIIHCFMNVDVLYSMFL